VSPEAEEGIYWDQEADLVLCINPCGQIWATPAKFGQKSSISTGNIFAKKKDFDKRVAQLCSTCEVLHKYAKFLGLHVVWEEYLSSTFGVAFRCHAL
jgi:hypothetical protein